jgi:hypothetical protein
MSESAISLLIGKAASAVLEVAAEARQMKVRISYSDTRAFLIDHLQHVQTWANTISIRTLLKDKRLQDCFVELAMQSGLRHGTGILDARLVSRKGTRLPEEPAISTQGLYCARGHAVILGRPGAGKTTTLQRIAAIALNEWEQGIAGLPVLVRLRDLTSHDSLVGALIAILGIDVRAPTTIRVEIRAAWEKRALLAWIGAAGVLLLIDGLDEAPPKLRTQIETDLRDIALAGGAHRLILTSRTAEYRIALPNVSTFTVLALSEAQIRDFAVRWLGLDQATTFLGAINQNPYAGAEVVPLTLAHLCAIYERDGELPSRPIEVYEQIIGLLIEDWDRQRGVYRTSKYSEFSFRKKERFLQAISYELSIAGRRGSFSESDLEVIYATVAPDFRLPEDEATAVIQEIESHTGLVQESGHRRFDFVHLVIQEFLAAMHAHRRAAPAQELVPRLPNEMALVVAYSSEPEAYVQKVLEQLLPLLGSDVAAGFAATFVARLSIERPEWHHSTESGWSLVALADFLCRSARVERKGDVRLPDPVALFFAQAVNINAMQWACAQADIFEERHAFRLIPRTGALLPAFLANALNARSETGLLLLKSSPAFRLAVKHKQKRKVAARRRLS